MYTCNPEKSCIEQKHCFLSRERDHTATGNLGQHLTYYITCNLPGVECPFCCVFCPREFSLVASCTSTSASIARGIMSELSEVSPRITSFLPGRGGPSTSAGDTCTVWYGDGYTYNYQLHIPSLKIRREALRKRPDLTMAAD